MQGPPFEHPPIEKQQPDFIWISTLIYGFVLGLGLTILHVRARNYDQVLQLFWPIGDWLDFFLIVILSFAFLLTASLWLEFQFPSYKAIKIDFAKIFKNYSVGTLFYLSLISGIAEEIFFRGALVPLIGIVPAALLFAILHIGPGGRLSLWTLWAGLAGVLFGFIYETQQNLTAVILIHVTINFFSFLTLKRMQIRSLSN